MSEAGSRLNGMNKLTSYIVGSVIAAIVVAVLAFVGARNLLGSGGQEPERGVDAAASASAQAGEGDVVKRPACPEGTVADVDLECLGAQAQGAAKDVQVVNVWAWWCEPCRAELPYMQEVATVHPDWDVVGVHADSNAANGAAFLQDIGIDLPSYQDDSNKFAGQLGLPGVIPITLVVYKGEVKKQYIKPFESTADIEKAVEEALA